MQLSKSVILSLVADKLRDIRETTSGAAEIIRELGSPELHKSLDKIKETAITAQNILANLREPEIVKNIENIRLMAESIEETSARVEKMVIEMKATGVIDQASSAMRSAKNALDSMGDQSSVGEMTLIIKELINSLKDLVDELKLTLVSSKKSGIIHNIKDVAQETDNIYKNLKE
ncbi:MAG: hypothetical protein WBP64_14605 [Nitrososphaeraceae archaeon]